MLKLQQITKSWTPSEDLDLSEVEKMLMNAAVVRPLHSELAIEVCSDLLEKLTTGGAGKDEEDQRKHLRVLCLAARVLGSLVCPTYLTGPFLKQVLLTFFITKKWDHLEFFSGVSIRNYCQD